MDTERLTTRIGELYMQRKTLRQISEIVSPEFRPDGPIYSDQAIRKHILKIRQEWRTSRVDNYEAKIDLELSRIDLLEASALAAWERSKGKYVTVTEKDSESGKEVTRKIETLAGDPRFLDQALKCVNKRCELLGLDAPKRTSLENPDGSALLSGITITYVAPPAQASDGNAGS